MDISFKIKTENAVPWGTYHYCGEGAVSWYEFALEIFRLARQHDNYKVKKIIPIPTSQYPTPARRPAYSVLDCSKIKRNFNAFPKPWEESLKEMMQRI